MTTMKARIESPYKPAPEAIKALLALESAIKASTLEPSLIELVKMRASQINGCAFCLHMHATDARKAGGNRDAALSADRLAGILALHAARTGGAGLDGLVDADLPDR